MKIYMRDPQTLAAPPEMKALHPLGTSPLITDKGVTYSETGAILDYILRHYGKGKLQPDPGSQDFDKLMESMHYAEGSGMLPILVMIYSNSTKTISENFSTKLQAQLAKHLSYMEKSLMGNDYLVGNTISAADIHVSFVAQTAKQYTSMANYPHILAWLERLEARPAYKLAEQKGGHFGAAKPCSTGASHLTKLITFLRGVCWEEVA